jgi:hypothetical protein
LRASGRSSGSCSEVRIVAFKVGYYFASDLPDVVAVGLAEWGTEAAALAALEATAAPAPAKAVWLEGKRLLMQAAWHAPKASEASVEPSP